MDQRSRSQLPVVTISSRGADRLRAGHVWVYRLDVLDAQGVEPGALVLVKERAHAAPDRRATRALANKKVHASPVLGSAFYSTASEIAVRMVSQRAVEDLEQLVRERIRAAVGYRERFVRNTNAYRVIFSEGDFLPGLIVDRYNDVLSLQVLAQAMDGEAMRGVLLSELQQRLAPTAIVERVDSRVRKLEQLPDRQSGVVWNRPSASLAPSPTVGEDPATSGRRLDPSALETPLAPHLRTE